MSTESITEVETKALAAKAASRKIALAGSAAKNAALNAIADALQASKATLFAANERDVAAMLAKDSRSHLVDRLTLTDKRIDEMCEGLAQVASLPDPIGEVLTGFRRPNGLQITKVRVPLGVIGIIYEARPNVTVDAAALTIKSGNSAVLRGGSESIHSNTALAAILRPAIERAGLPANAITLIESTDREAAQRLMTMNGVIDCLIPRGGAALIKSVLETATVPVIETGTGNCHVYVDAAADAEMAIAIVVNAKAQRPSVCNSAETLLIHRDIATTLLPRIGQALCDAGVELRGDDESRLLLPFAKVAAEDDWYAEYNALIMAVKVVGSLEEAVDHIDKYGTHHSDAIITEDYAAAQLFVDSVDSAGVFVNASTRFTDGFEFGFGAEIGISNQKLHARGPMGLEELTTYKYVIRGSGQIRE